MSFNTESILFRLCGPFLTVASSPKEQLGANESIFLGLEFQSLPSLELQL